MSDEKLSGGLERELQEVAVEATKFGFAPATYAGHASKIADNMRPLLARLERERDAARSEVLRMAEKLKITDPLLQSPAYSVGWNAALDMLIGDIGCLAPSVVSQPSREREVLETRHEALEDAAKMVEGLKYPYPVLTTQGMLDHIAKRIRNLTAAPASTGGQS